MPLSPFCDQSVPRLLHDRVQANQETEPHPLWILTELTGVPNLSALSLLQELSPVSLRASEQGDLSLVSLGEAIQGHLSSVSMDVLVQGHLFLVPLAVLTRDVDPCCPRVSLPWDMSPWGP